MSECESVHPAEELSFDTSRLPSLLTFEDGRPVTSAAEWSARRSELLELFKAHIYGRSLPAPPHLSFELRERSDNALDGKAVRQQVRVRFSETDDNQWMDLLIHLPKSDQPVPIFVGLNFHGNHTIHPDPAIPLTPRWVRNRKSVGPTENRAVETSRGASAIRWPLEQIIDQGFGVATAYYGDLAPDHPDHWRTGVYSLFHDPATTGPDNAPDNDPDDAPRTISVWAWGLSRAMDYFESEPAIDAARVAVMGHSRLGKTALWAGANDERFAGVISNNSGCGGASLYRHHVGEDILLQKKNRRLEYWFCPAYARYCENEDALPVDQHQLIALSAPRPTYVASAQEDAGADPVGEFMGIREAASAWELFGYPNLGERTMPAVDEPRLTPRLGYHIRSGGHDVTDFDWQTFMRFIRHKSVER